MKKRLIELAAVAGVLLLLSMVFCFNNVDYNVASAVLGPNKISPIGTKFWPAGAQLPWTFFYNWAAIPAILLAAAAVLLLVAGFFVRKIAGCRKKVVFILLFIALGPGLVVNVLLKDQLGRARPREVVDFGGSHQFTHIWETGSAGKNSSFPSGHAAIAFFTMAPWFILRDNKRKIAAGFLVFGMVFGGLVGIARILQGGHFVTDVIWSAGLIYIVGGVIALVLGFGREVGRADDAACPGVS